MIINEINSFEIEFTIIRSLTQIRYIGILNIAIICRKIRESHWKNKIIYLSL